MPQEVLKWEFWKCLKCQGMKLGEEQDGMFLLFLNPLSLIYLPLSRSKGRSRKHGNEEGSMQRQFESWEAIKTYKKDNEPHSLLNPSLSWEDWAGISFGNGNETRSGAVGKMSDRGRKNEVERPRYTHAKEWHLFANNSPEFREERLEGKELGPS